VAVFRRVKVYQVALDRRLGPEVPIDFGGRAMPLVVVPLHRLDRVAAKALRFAAQLSPEVQVVHVRNSEQDDHTLGPRWPRLVVGPARAAGVPEPRLVTLTSEYRELITPVVDYVQHLARDREVVVVVPEVVPRRWYHHLLHSHHATLLKAALLLRGGPNVIIANTPWHE
jgi:hypothetical protein